MAITLGATVTSKSITTAGASGWSGNHTVDAGTTLTVVKILDCQTVSTPSVLSWNASSLIIVPSSQVTNTVRVSMYYIVNPTEGTFSLSFTMNASTRGGWIAENWLGVDTTTPFGTCVTATGTSVTPSVAVGSASGEVAIDAMAGSNGDGTTVSSVGSGQAETIANFIGSAGAVGSSNRCGGSWEAGAASVTMDWTLSSSRAWAISGVSLKPAAAATTLAFARTRSGLGTRSGSRQLG